MRKQKRGETFIKYIVSGVITGVMIALASLLIAVVLPSDANYSSESEATAQYLEQYPSQVPAFIQIDEDCMIEDEHCFWIVPEVIAGRSDAPNEMRQQSETLVLQIDGQVQADFQSELVDADLYVALPIDDFGAGLHLVEVEMQGEDGRVYYHMWSVRNEAGLVTAPPTLAVPPTHSTAVPTGAESD